MTVPRRAVVLGIAGGSGSGKTTIARRLAEAFPNRRVVIVPHDAYYRDRPDLSEQQRARLNFDHPESFENELLVNHLHRLRGGEAIEQPIYSYSEHRRLEETLPVGPARVILLEGILALAIPELREAMDIRLYVDCDSDERLMRRLSRDLNDRGRTVDSVLAQYRETVRPMHFQFVEPSKRYADVIIPRGGHNRVAIDVIVSKIRMVLEEDVPEESGA